MNLVEHMQELAILRETGEPDGSQPVSIALAAADLRRLPVWLRRRKHLGIENIFICDLPPGSSAALNIPGCPSTAHALDGMASALDGDIIFLFAQEWFVRLASMAIPGLGTKKIWLAGHGQIAKRQPLPDYYSRNSVQLERAYSLLGDALDREAFARRACALASGDPGWLRIAPFMEYRHPVIGPKPGDVMIDGGVSDMVSAQELFAEQVGARGRIYGFEPIRWMADKARSQLAGFGQYNLVSAGLADKDGEAEFASLRDSSHIGAQNGAATEICALRSIDSFAREHALERIDCIKLDIEGAELAALHGASEVIRRDLPSLVICLYHKPADLYEIPLYIHDLDPRYEMHVAHSSAGFTDTILYAQVHPQIRQVQAS